jgi:hypothetical protein
MKNQKKQIKSKLLVQTYKELSKKLKTTTSLKDLISLRVKMKSLFLKLRNLAKSMKISFASLLLVSSLSFSAKAGAEFTERTGGNNPFNSVDVGTVSTPNFVDIDGDGDYDAFIGEDFGEIKYFRNTGSPIAPTFVEQTGADNPFNTVDVGYNAAPVLVDIDSDGDYDAFIGEYVGNINYYLNTGNAKNPNFVVQNGAANPFDGITVAKRSYPSFVDIDSDGDYDAFIAEYDGTISFYLNTGNALSPIFTAQSGANNPFNGVNKGDDATINFIDIDGDGDFDAFIGEHDGILNFYRNTGTPLDPTFTEVTGGANPLDGVDIEFESTAVFVDIDSDGDFDTFIGELDGVMNYYENTGSSTFLLSFTEQTGASNPMDGETFFSSSSPELADLDKDGDLDLYVSSAPQSDQLNYFENQGDAVSANFVEISDPITKDWFDMEYTPRSTFVDIDGDGDLDAFFGNDYGFIYYFENQGSATLSNFAEQTGADNPLDLAHNVYEDYTDLEFQDIDADGDFDVFIGDNSGTIIYYENQGSATSSNFVLATGADDPFDGEDLGTRSKLDFYDLDNDGDLDLIGLDGFVGIIKYYENIGDARTPDFVERIDGDNPFDNINDDQGFIDLARVSLDIEDYDSDGLPELFIGDGNDRDIKFYESSTISDGGGESTAPEISIKSNSTTITSGDDSPSAGDNTDFGFAGLSATVSQTFTVENWGSATLSFENDPVVEILGLDADQFAVSSSISDNSLTFGGASTFFVVDFGPSSVGDKSATVSIDNDDSDENPYWFAIEGSATTTPEAFINTVKNIDFESASITADIFNGFVESSITFNYGETSGDLDLFVAYSNNAVSASTTTFTISEDLTGLLPNTEYFYDIYLEANGNATSSESSFTTTPANAEAYTSTVTNITGFSASITFDVYNGNTFSSATILYGESENSLTLSQEYSNNPIDGSTSTITLSQVLTGLNPLATYHYAIVNANVNNTATSSTSTFETGFGNPTIEITSLIPSSTFADVSFDAFNAEQSATITYWLSETQGDYGSNSFSYDNNPFDANSSTQTLEQTISNLNIEREYFYYFEIDNGLSSASTTEMSFWTLSEKPEHSNTFYQIGEELTTIELGFESLTNSGADGYIILQSSLTPSEYPENGTEYSEEQTLGNSTIAKIVTITSQTSTTITDLPKEKSYVYTLVPYNWDESNPETYHYNITNPQTVTGFTIPTLGEWLLVLGGSLLVLGAWQVRRVV